jgi:cyanophycinase-like exopeptidase
MNRRNVLILLIISLALTSADVSAQIDVTPVLVPVGGGLAGDLLPGNSYQPTITTTRTEYTRIFTGLASTALARTVEGQVKVLVLPIALSPNPASLTNTQKTDLLRIAESRFFHIKEACQKAMPAGISCQASLAPIYVRTDALDPVLVDYFAQDWSVVFILSGDPDTAMNVIQGTPVEAALGMLYRQGVIIAGTGSGAKILSKAVIAGYQGIGQNPSLMRGGVRVWNGEDQHGLLFGVQNVILETQFYQLGRLGGLLQAISTPGAPHLGLGLDAFTGMHISNGQKIEDVFGLYSVTILDAETYSSADESVYRDIPAVSSGAPVLSIRNVLVHLLAPGPYTYDLITRQHSLEPTSPLSDRDFSSLGIPPEAGPLILSGDLSENLEGNPILNYLGDLSGGEDGQVLVITGGFPSDSSTERMANQIASELDGKPIKLMIWRNASILPSFPDYYTGIIFLWGNQSKLKPELLTPIKEAWLAGTPVLTDDGAASVMGSYFSFHGPTPTEGKPAERATQASFLQGETQIRAGLGGVDINIEPQILEDNRWGRLFSLAYNHPSQLAIGISRNTGLVIDQSGARVIGSSGVFVLDLRTARLDLGDNRSFVVANGLLDVYTPGENLWTFAVSDVPSAENTSLMEDVETLTGTVTIPLTEIESATTGAYPEINSGLSVLNNWTGIVSLTALAVLLLLLGLLFVRRR